MAISKHVCIPLMTSPLAAWHVFDGNYGSAFFVMWVAFCIYVYLEVYGKQD